MLALRVTYVGELGFELHVPADVAVAVWDALLDAGGDLGVRPVGLAAMESLRLEKGYCDYGIDIENTDGVVEAGLGFAVALDKASAFAGRDAVLAARADRSRRMVHVLLEDPEPLLHGGEPLLHKGSWVGYLQAGAFGHTLGAGVGLAMCRRDDAGTDGVTAAWLADGGFEVDVAGRRSDGAYAGTGGRARPDGVPIGVQVVGRSYDDATVMQVGAALVEPLRVDHAPDVARDVAGADPVEDHGGVPALHEEGRHERQVEHADGLPDGAVLGLDERVERLPAPGSGHRDVARVGAGGREPQRVLPAGRDAEPGAGGGQPLVQR